MPLDFAAVLCPRAMRAGKGPPRVGVQGTESPAGGRGGRRPPPLPYDWKVAA